MEYLQTLKDRLAQGTVPLKEAIQWALEVVEALTVAHEKGIIHRDLAAQEYPSPNGDFPLENGEGRLLARPCGRIHIQS